MSQTPPTISQIAVVGAGTMGAGIAALAALAGVAVVLVDAHTAVLAKARERIARDLARGGAPAAMERIRFTENLDDVAPAQIVIEAVPEDLAIKTRLFADLESRVTPEAILATNTSALSVAAITAQLAHRERVLGLHFFNPPTAMKLVEIVHIPQTASDALKSAEVFVRELGRTPITVADTPGFVVNRVARPFYLQSLHALENGIASAAALDALARGIGFPMGPFALMDLIGLDVNLATSEAVFAGTGAARLEPSTIQAQMVVAGKLGRKTGAGFYQYASGKAEMPPPPLIALAGHPAHSPLVLLDPDGVLAAMASAAGEQGIVAHVCADAGEAARQKMPVVFDAYRYSREELERAGITQAVGIGVVGPLRDQQIVELVVDAGNEEPHAYVYGLLAAAKVDAIAVAPGPGLYLGRTIASIINEAAFALEEKVASADDIDLAIKLGVRYPMGPFEWAKRIGTARVAAILERLGHAPAALLRR